MEKGLNLDERKGGSSGPQNLLEGIREMFALKEADIRTLNPLNLAFVGDGIFELVVRTVLVGRAGRPVNELNRRKCGIVKAAAQARLGEVLEGRMTPREADIYRRGRNAKPATRAKNASVADYRKATGVEALFGYLYLTGQEERLLILVKEGLVKLGMEI